MRTVPVSVTTTGGAGVATGSGTGRINGRVIGVKVDYHASAPATTDVTITADARTLLTLSNQSTDKFVTLRTQTQDATGANIAGSAEAPIVPGQITVDVAQSNALDPAVIVQFYIEE